VIHPIAIDATGLEKTFHDPRRGPVEAVRGLDFQCRRGEIYGLLGPNGAGKTTTLRMLATILRPSAGRASIDGVDVAADPLEARRRLGFLSGTTGLYPRLGARETLLYFGKLHGMERARLEARVEELLDLFEISSFL
jgi:sodium transport system ATP-binding protein